jgi:ribosome biogenesis GTPase
MNKIDLVDEDIDRDERIEDYRKTGYRILEVSAKTGEGMDAFVALVSCHRSVLVGQSGVGKTTLLNVLDPSLGLRTAEINRKYSRGNHTTTMAMLHEIPSLGDGTIIIDTPGIRRMVPSGVSADNLAAHMNEFAPLLGQCSFGMSCRHEKEPGCKILEAINAGLIHEDRYESYLRMRDELAGRLPYWEQE